METPKLNPKYALLIGLLGAIVIALFSFNGNYQLGNDIKSWWPEGKISSLQKEVIYIINKGEGESEEYRMEGSKRSTVFSLLGELSQRENFRITSKHYDFGVFVESIDGAYNGDENRYWQYWVNDKLGEVASDKKDVKAGDRVEWKFEVPPEFF